MLYTIGMPLAVFRGPMMSRLVVADFDIISRVVVARELIVTKKNLLSMTLVKIYDASISIIFTNAR